MNIVLQGVWVANKRIWNVCVKQSKGVHDTNQFRVCSLYKQLGNQKILQELVFLIKGVRCTSYLIGDSTYPICKRIGRL
jgi:hypothetical protein